MKFLKRYKDGQSFPTDKPSHGGSFSGIESRSSESNDRELELLDFVEQDVKTLNKNWQRKELDSPNGKSIIYVNKEDPSLTVEMHTDFDEEDEDRFWYIFSARNGKGIENSPDSYSERGSGYTEKDAEKFLIKKVMMVDDEL